MRKVKFTKGPYVWDYDRLLTTSRVASPYLIDYLSMATNYRHEDESNKALFSHADQLYWALDDALARLRVHEGESKVVQEIAALLTKAGAVEE